MMEILELSNLAVRRIVLIISFNLAVTGILPIGQFFALFVTR